MTYFNQKKLIEHYKKLFLTYGDTAKGVQYSDDSGQKMRFEKLTEIGNLKKKKVLDYGCGLGHLYPYLVTHFLDVDYTGIDIVPEMVAFAAAKYPKARFLCLNILKKDLTEDFDYVLINGVFNNAMMDADSFMEKVLINCFSHCRIAMGFNFISKYVNFIDHNMAYHDPASVLNYCIKSLSVNVNMHHAYGKRDVAVFVYR